MTYKERRYLRHKKKKSWLFPTILFLPCFVMSVLFNIISCFNWNWARATNLILWTQNQHNHNWGHWTKLEQVLSNFIASEFAQPGIRHFNAALGSLAKEIVKEIVSNPAEIRRTCNWKIIWSLKYQTQFYGVRFPQSYMRTKKLLLRKHF